LYVEFSSVLSLDLLRLHGAASSTVAQDISEASLTARSLTGRYAQISSVLVIDAVASFDRVI